MAREIALHQNVEISMEQPIAAMGWLKREQNYLIFLMAAFFIIGITTGTPHIAMWVAWSLADRLSMV